MNRGQRAVRMPDRDDPSLSAAIERNVKLPHAAADPGGDDFDRQPAARFQRLLPERTWLKHDEQFDRDARLRQVADQVRRNPAD